jgi:hypothetical protein
MNEGRSRRLAFVGGRVPGAMNDAAPFRLALTVWLDSTE